MSAQLGCVDKLEHPPSPKLGRSAVCVDFPMADLPVQWHDLVIIAHADDDEGRFDERVRKLVKHKSMPEKPE